jgi:hypothetical protein
MSIAPASGSAPTGRSSPRDPGGRAGPPGLGRPFAAGIALAFLLVGIAYTAPLVGHLRTTLPYAAVPPEGRERAVLVQGDYLQFYYYLWLFRDRVLAGQSVLRDPFQFATDGPRSNLPNTFLPFAFLYVPLSVLDPRVAYNLLVLLSFPLAALTAILLAHRYGVPRWAAIVAGAVFACAPYRVATLLGGHPAGLAYFLVPLTLWGLEGALAGSVAGGVWCAAGLVSLALVEPHFVYFAGLGLPLYLVARGGLAGWTPACARPGGGWWILALAIATAPGWGTGAALRRDGWELSTEAAVAIGLVVSLGALGLWQCGAGWLQLAGAAPDGRTAARRSLLGCLPWLLAVVAGGRSGGRVAALTVALPVVIHGVLSLRGWLTGRGRALPVLPLALAAAGALAGAGYLFALKSLVLTRSVAGAGRTLHEVLLFSPTPADLLLRVNPSAGRAVYPGLIALALAVIGLARLAWRPPEPRHRILLVFGPLLALAVALSLGPRMTALPLFEAGFRLVPTWSFIRQPAKFQVLAGLALAVLAAVGSATLGTRYGRPAVRLGLATLLAALVAAEYHPWRPIGLSRVPVGGPAYDAIGAQGPRVLYLPVWPGDSSFSAVYLYATTLTRVPMLNGYSTLIDRAYVSEVYRALETLNLGALGEAEYATLRRFSVRQVVLDRDAFPAKVSPFGPAFTLAGLSASPYLEPARPATDDDGLWLFRVRERPGPAPGSRPTSPLGIHWEAESLTRGTGQVADDPLASNGRIVEARTGRDRPGFVVFGPYRLLPAGAFRAVFRLRGADAQAALEVTTAGGRRVLGTQPVRLADGRFQEVPVVFALDAPAPVEYRVAWNGTGRIAVDAITVAFADVPDPAPLFEVEALVHELRERTDPDAEGGRAGYADPAVTPRDRLWQGPLRRYSPGRYRLWVRLKLDRPASGPLVWCGAQMASLGPVRGGRELAGPEMGAPGRYVELAVPFTLTEASVLEFPCFYRGETGVWFDRLRIERLVP